MGELCYNTFMKKILAYAAFFIALSPFLFGCGSQIQLDATRFIPLPGPNQTIFTENEDTYVSYEGGGIVVTMAIYEYNAIIGVPISITNKTGADMDPSEYSFGLYDGRDLKPVKMLTRDDLVKFKAQYSGGSSGAIQDKVIEASMNNIMKAVNVPTKDKVIEVINFGIDNYFSFRPIYNGETRSGILAFIPDYKLEFPLSFAVRKGDETITLRFIPPTKK